MRFHLREACSSKKGLSGACSALDCCLKRVNFQWTFPLTPIRHIQVKVGLEWGIGWELTLWQITNEYTDLSKKRANLQGASN